MATLEVIEWTLEDIEREIQGLEEKYPWFESHWEDDEICSCCKIDYREWDRDTIREWERYDMLRFFRGY